VNINQLKVNYPSTVNSHNTIAKKLLLLLSLTDRSDTCLNFLLTYRHLPAEEDGKEDRGVAYIADDGGNRDLSS
jgi:hypothetical protein